MVVWAGPLFPCSSVRLAAAWISLTSFNVSSRAVEESMAPMGCYGSMVKFKKELNLWEKTKIQKIINFFLPRILSFELKQHWVWIKYFKLKCPIFASRKYSAYRRRWWKAITSHKGSGTNWGLDTNTRSKRSRASWRCAAFYFGWSRTNIIS